MRRPRRKARAIAIALGSLLLALLPPVASAEEESYHCECCRAHFGKDPNTPRYWARGLGYGRLIEARKYDEVLSRFNDAFRRNVPHTLADVAWVSEALFSLGALKSGIHDPNRRFMFFLAEKPKDPVGHDLWWMHGKYGGKIWNQEAIDQYGDAALCTITEVRKKYPQYSVAFVRHVSILIALGRFEDVLTMVRGLKEDSIAIVEPLGEYLAKFMSQYIGIAHYHEGVRFLATVKQSHGISKETQAFWTERLLRGVNDAEMPPAQKQRLRARIRAL